MLANLIGIPLTGLVIMPAGMAVLVTGALPGPQVIDNAALLTMQVGIDSLLAVNGWFASLPATPRRVAPPPPAMLMLLYGGMVVVLCLDMPAAARRVALSGIAAAAVAVSLFSPAPDGIYFARAKGGHLVLAGPQGEADTIPAGGRASARPLSPYLADDAARILVQSVPTGGSLTDGGPAGLRRHDHPAVGQVAIVTSRRRLTAGCRTGAAMVVTTVRADYPCRDGTPLVSLSGLPTGNYTLRITRGGITASGMRSVFAHQSGQPALNLDLAGLEIARFVTRVFRLQADPTGLLQQRFQRGFLFLDQGHDDLAVIRRVGTFDHHRVAVENACLDHRVADDLEREMLAPAKHACRNLELVRGSLSASIGVPAAIRPRSGRLTASAAAATARPTSPIADGRRFHDLDGTGPVGKAADMAAFLQTRNKPVNARFRRQPKRVPHLVKRGGTSFLGMRRQEIQKFLLLACEHDHLRTFMTCSMNVLHCSV